MTTEVDRWPRYSDPYKALVHETAQWHDARLDRARDRYDRLEGSLPSRIGSFAIAIVDGEELPENFVLPELCAAQSGIEAGAFGALWYVNYQGRQPPGHTEELASAIREQSSIPAALSVTGYQGTRRLDRIRSDAYDIAVVHALNEKIEHPVVGISVDADTTGMAPDFLRTVSSNKYVGQPATVWGVPVTFDTPGGAELPAYRLLAYMHLWFDLINQDRGIQPPSAGSMALTLATYAIAGDLSRQLKSDPYGTEEAWKLVLNIWERLTGQEGSFDNPFPALARCSRRVDSLVQVSPRREVLALARHLVDPDARVNMMSTEANNPYRRLTNEEVADLAREVSSASPRFREQLDNWDEKFSQWLPIRTGTVQARLRQAREELELPKAAFDT